MRKQAFILVMLMAVTAFASYGQAARETPPVRSTGYFGVYYNAVPLPSNVLAFLYALMELRAGFGADVVLPLNKYVGFGPELGFQYMYFADQSSGNISGSFIDIPIRFQLDFFLGQHIRLEALTGLLVNAVLIGGVSTFAAEYDVGARVQLGGFFAEGSYEIPVATAGQAYFRFGAGLGFALK